MSTISNRILLSCVVFSIVICLCMSVVGIVWAGYILVVQRDPLADLSSWVPTPAVTLSPGEIDRQMDEIQQQVIEIRGLQPSGPVVRALLSPEELRQHVMEDFIEDYSEQEAREDAIVLASFGLLEPDFDLYNFFLDLYSEQIAGFYDDETKEMYVVKDKDFQGPERLTYAHEYAHVLQDQTYDIENGLNYDDEACETDSEKCAAIQALLEGDATLVELNWFSLYATSEDQQEIFQFYDTFEGPVYDSAPSFMQEDFVFPYQYGQVFVQTLYDQGGWEAVNQAYQNLPVSTEQILHPERYPEDVPVPVNLPDLSTILGEGWRELDRGVMGEWYTFLILARSLDSGTRLDVAQAEDAAEGWGGDAYVVYYNEQDSTAVMVLTLVWESSRDAEEFATAFIDYATARFGRPELNQETRMEWDHADGYTLFLQEDEQTTWILAPDDSMAEIVLDNIMSR